MTRAYASQLALLCLLAPLAAWSQGLEEKLIESRLRQADQRLVDSLMTERSRAGLGKADRTMRRDAADEFAIGPDSLLSDLEMADSLKDTSLTAGSAKKSKRARVLRPKRYEQRIFRNVDRSAFASAQGSTGRGYVLGAGDRVTVSLWGDKEKVYDLDLNREGKVFVEGVGLVPLAGLNMDEAQERLKERLARIYSGISRGSTKVEISLGKAGPIRVFVLGEVASPGGYVFSGNTSLLTAMYYAKGPTDIGTVRNLQLNRSGKKHPLDLYKYLIRGETLAPNVLLDGDVLFSGRAEALVEIEGDIGRPAVYELKKGEGVKELLEFAGGLNSTAATHTLSLQRIFEGGRPDYRDLPSPQDFLSGKATFELQDGDRLLVERSTDSGQNYLTVRGPVKYPGTYEASEVATVEDLIKKAGGLREDAYLGRVHVLSFRPDGSSSLRAYSLARPDMDTIRLAKRDHIILYSQKEMFIPDSVEIQGAVFNPGRFEYREGITVKDLVILAGGYLPQHQSGQFIVFRGGSRERIVDQVKLNVEPGLAKSDEGFPLTAGDFVNVPVDPQWYRKEVITLSGQFQYPGKYTLLHPGERLAAVIERTGGFNPSAYVDGARLFRSKDSVGKIGVSIREALKRAKSRANIPMMGGDSIYVPGRLSTVKVIGEVGFETSVLYKEGEPVGYYIEQAGGFTRRSEKDLIVVQYANGETSKDGYFNRKPDAGSVILVPQGPEPKPIDLFGGLNAILGTLSIGLAVILSIQAIKD